MERLHTCLRQVVEVNSRGGAGLPTPSRATALPLPASGEFRQTDVLRCTRAWPIWTNRASKRFSYLPWTAPESWRSGGEEEDEQVEEDTMTKISVIAAVVGLALAASSTAEARGGGASAFAPGQQFRAHGSVAGHPGASGYAPGRL